MSFTKLIEIAANKNNFNSLDDYLNFACLYLEKASYCLQAVIVCQNEQKYQFWQYKEDGHFNITRPLNSELMYTIENNELLKITFIEILHNIRSVNQEDDYKRQIICKSIYTIQQCIGAALDGLPSGNSNTARKINGDLFERLIKLIIITLGI